MQQANPLHHFWRNVLLWIVIIGLAAAFWGAMGGSNCPPGESHQGDRFEYCERN